MGTPNWHPALTWLRALREPGFATTWSESQWEQVIAMARRERLLARLAVAVDAESLGERIPARPRAQLLGAARLAEARTRALCWAVERLPDMLDQPAYPLVLLKGAAYIAQNLAIAAGRMPSDLDILIPAEHLEHAQFFLKQAGWSEPDLTEADRRFYIEWSHELPPLRHRAFGVELDVHHNILPPRGGRMVDVRRLVEGLQPTRLAPWQVLADTDQLLHSAAHLFRDPEPQHRIRDLVDIDGLLAHFAVQPGFMTRLLERARALDLVDELALALHFTARWLGNSLAADHLGEVTREASSRSRLVAGLYARVLEPVTPIYGPSWTQRASAIAILADYHRRRLPLAVLVPHLWRKWRLGHAAEAEAAETARINAP